MKLAVMQPYLFPYVGYYQLMAHVDQWVIFDNTQFIDKGWINRNRILHPDETKGWQYLTVPLSKRKQYDKICDIKIAESIKWRQQILGKLTCYKRKAPFYGDTIDFVRSCIDYQGRNLSSFLENSLIRTKERLGINTRLRRQVDVIPGEFQAEAPGLWALEIARAAMAEEYINPHGGFQIFDERDFEKENIRLSFLKPHLKEYSQRRHGFVPGLSIIDVMMWNSLDQIREMIQDDYRILTWRDLEQESL